jgi:hypothetical protein
MSSRLYHSIASWLIICALGCGARTQLEVPHRKDGGPIVDAGSDGTFAPLVAIDGEHACYRRPSGELVCWGHGPKGNYWPDGGRPTVPSPELIVTNGVPMTIAPHISSTSILLANGNIDSWGYDDAFQRLGDGLGAPEPPPGVTIFAGAAELIGNPLGDFICGRRADG